MLIRLIQNWPYKLAALLIAIFLHAYVVHNNDPRTSTQINIPLTLTGVPDGLTVTTSNSTQSVTLQVSGPASSLENISGSSFVATANLRGARAGVNQPVQIQVTASSSAPQDVSVVSQSPRTAVVTMDTEVRQRLPVRVVFDRIAPAGLIYGSPKVVPPIASVEGPSLVMERVAHLIVHGDDAVSGETSSSGMLDGFAPIVAVDSQQETVDGLTILPEQAEVKIPVGREAAMKTLIVNASVAGIAAYPAQVTSVEVTPSRVTVTGSPSILDHTSVVDTAPVDITGASADIVRTVAVNLPPGLSASTGSPVMATVTVHIRPTGSSPTPAPTGLATQAGPTAVTAGSR